ncbi:hypothetical protein L1887_11409 [Cichorium endivia]|nr:hypothetical protein L1887_11409 [Cichorium endivia]
MHADTNQHNSLKTFIIVPNCSNTHKKKIINLQTILIGSKPTSTMTKEYIFRAVKQRIQGKFGSLGFYFTHRTN